MDFNFAYLFVLFLSVYVLGVSLGNYLHQRKSISNDKNSTFSKSDLNISLWRVFVNFYYILLATTVILDLFSGTIRLSMIVVILLLDNVVRVMLRKRSNVI